jgi:hypothetical protein
MIGEQESQDNFWMMLLCRFHHSRRQTVKTTVISHDKIFYSIFCDMPLNLCRQGREKFFASFPVAYKKASVHDRMLNSFH